ncbi:MAG: hypothetical protein NTV97_00685 [Alphaproteobacteria bacterium]|nr:hypothetical protein [Alphaproteobacteria bacterium]
MTARQHEGRDVKSKRIAQFGVWMLALAMLAGGDAQAQTQTWLTTTQLTSANSSCFRLALNYEFTLSGSELTVKGPTGQSYRGAVAADGKVTIEYKGTTSAGGNVTIGGNARSRELRYSTSVLGNCSYALVPATEPATSAYQGNAGDWALGRWNGQRFTTLHGSAVQPQPSSLLVEKRPDGKVLCRWGDPETIAGSALASKCTITASDISLLSASDTTVQLTRNGATRLEGSARNSMGSGRIDLAR